MGDNLLPGGAPPVDQTVPSGSDVYDSPYPSWFAIGQALAQGQAAVNNSTNKLTPLLEWLKSAVATIVGALIGLLLWLVAQIMDIYSQATESDISAFDGIVRRSLAHVFNIQLPGAAARNLGNNVDTAGAASQIGQAIINSLTAGVGGCTPGEIKPDDKPAENFLGLMARIGVEGWLEGFIGEMISLGHIEAAMELVPIMADVLGFARLSRRALAAPMKILVEDPYTYKLQQLCRPTLLSEGIALKQMIRDPANAAKWRGDLQLRGYSEDRIAALVNDARRFLSLDDVVWLILRTNWTLDQGVQYLVDQGWTSDDAQTQITIKQLQLTEPAAREIVRIAGEAYVRGETTLTQLADTIDGSGLPQYEKDAATQLYSFRRTLEVKHLTVGEWVAAIKGNIANVTDLEAAMARENYPADEETVEELLVLGQITSKQDAANAKAKAAADKAAAAKAKADAAAAAKAAKLAAEADKGLSITQFEALVRDGLRTIGEYQAFLQGKHYSIPDATQLAQVLSDQLDAAKAKAAKAAALKAQPKAKSINIAQLERGVLDGIITVAEYTTRLMKSGYSTDDTNLLVSELEAQLAAQQAKQKAHDEAAAKLKARGLDLAQEELAVKLGIHSIDDFTAFLAGAGFTPEAAATLEQILQAQLAKLAAAKQAKAAAAAKVKTKGLSLAQIDKTVLDGVHDLAWYKGELAQLGFSPDDQNSLASVLQVELDKAKAVAAARAAATAKLKTKDVSLATVESLVVAGLVPFTTLAQEMTEAGLDADSQQLVQLSVMEKITKARAAQAKLNKPPKPPKPPEPSLAQNEQAVLDGIMTPAAYQAELVKAGYTSDDVQQLMALLQSKLAAAAAKAAKKGKP